MTRDPQTSDHGPYAPNPPAATLPLGAPRPAPAIPPLRICQLYPDQMNIYGDWGNTITLVRRAQWAGIEVEVLDHRIGEELPAEVDILLGGGGQDSGQVAIAPDLRRHGERIRAWADDGVPMLVICGSYQLFGHVFIPAAQDASSAPLEGISVFDAETRGSSRRLIGNLTVATEQFGDVVGYENHSGLTQLGPGTVPLGRVVPFGEDGSVEGGNDGTDGTEGAIRDHVIGTYLHGSVLPKNPRLADWLLARAVERRTGEDLYRAPEIDESMTDLARRAAMSRPR